MGTHEQLQIFQAHNVRSVWDDEQEKWYFSVVDVIEVLTDSEDPSKYWRVLKTRLKKEGNETATNCSAFKMRAADGKMRLTDEWKRGGVNENEEFALLTDLMSKVWSGMTTKEYKHLKGLKKENLRDNMTNLELLLNAIAEETATQISKERNPEGLKENAIVAKEGADVAKNTRSDIEKRIGHTVISAERAIDHTNPKDMLPLNDAGTFIEE